MFCKNCGTKLGENDKFCNNCGTKREDVIVEEKKDEKDFYTDEEEDNLSSVNNNVSEVKTDVPVITDVKDANVSNNSNNSGEKKKTNVGLIIGIVVGVILLVFIIIVAGLFFLTKSIIGTVTEPTGIVEKNTGKLDGDGYTISYDSDWVKKKGKTVNGKEIYYLYNDLYSVTFSPIGRSSFTSNGVVDSFDSYSNRSKLYNAFEEYWNGELEANSQKVYTGSFSFTSLKDDLYYAYMDYGTSATETNGRFYLVVSEQYNSICSFNLAGTKDTLYSLAHLKVMSLLESMKFNNSLMDDDTGIISSMSNWNMYKDVRSGSLGKKKVLEGSWRKLSSSTDYWVFKNNKFSWYKDYNDLSDNYWEGTYSVLKGKDGLKSVGLDESKVESIVASSKGKTSSDDIYTVVMKPSKIISGGVDKSSTNISSDDWKYVFILVDHGSEGIEAQVLNVNTYETHYLVKVKD